MLIRAIALSLALLIGVGTMLPLVTETAEAGKKRQRRYHKKKKKYRKYSRAWWKRHRALMKKRRAMLARRRAIRLRRLRLARLRNKSGQKPVVSKNASPKPQADPKMPAVLPTGQPAPAGWLSSSATSSEVVFSIDGGRGTAAISVIGPATGETVDVGRNKLIGGVPTTALRREVINRMIRENGWVVNDYQKQIGNKKVYVVVAQSQGPGGKLNSRMFYFTEVEGRIFSVATNAAVESADRIAEESEKVINSMQARPRPTQQASTRE